MASPWLPTLAAPMGHTCVAAFRALSAMNRVIEALSCTGFVFGMQQTAVNPPRAAASVPVAIVSEDSWPGSRKCACRSMNPGATISPLASSTSVPLAGEIFPGAPTDLIFSPSIRMSLAASAPENGSTTRPFLIRSIRGFLRLFLERRMRAALCRSGHQQVQNRHPHRYAVGHLLEHAGLRAVGNFRCNLDSAVHRAGMQHN